ncbi:dihydrodipicolinate synthase family protein [Candidatus Pelagibacter sp. HIMB1782]|uniref:dihydrodipicolinate synthase family protein n=1 Tax=Candidatus Pelagibacter sp. HIMB1782 TaxID=3413375 RepID=UPI003F83470A
MIKGIYAATLSILNRDLGLDIKKTISHAEKVIDDGCHGVVFFGSTGQSQLISLSEKINLINNLPTSVQREKFIIGTGLNSLGDTVSIMKISKSLGFNNFLIMPPAYYKYEDNDVFNFYAQIIKQIPDSKILLYNFEKLSGYKFSEDIIYKLVENFSEQIIGVKDSSYNLFEKIKINNFSMMPGSESKLLKGLELGCSGIITATTNATSKLARKVFDDFLKKNEQTENQKLCDVRSTFENYNLISGLHTFFGQKDQNYKNLLPPLKILTDNEEKKLFNDLENLNFK